MPGDWIKMREDLHEDPAVLQIAQELEVRPETVVGMCHRFWGWVSRQCHDGSVTGVTLVSLGSVIGLSGFPELLVRVGWLEYDDSDPQSPVIHIPKFERHLSEGAKARALASERQRNARRHAKNEQTSRSERDEIVTPLSLNIPSSSGAARRRKAAEKIEIPPELNCADFAEVWKAWEQHRLEIRKPLTQTSMERQLKKLAQVGVERAVAMIEHTIAMGWVGLREPEQSKQADPRGNAAALQRYIDKLGGDNDGR